MQQRDIIVGRDPFPGRNADAERVDGEPIHISVEDPMPDSLTFERQKLYEEVWTDPVSTVSKRYGLPDHALRKVCRELGVPTPSSAYWPALRLGKTKPERATLPAHAGPFVFEYVVSTADQTTGYRVGGITVKRQIEQEESNPDNRIVVATEGAFQDPFVKAELPSVFRLPSAPSHAAASLVR